MRLHDSLEQLYFLFFAYQGNHFTSGSIKQSRSQGHGTFREETIVNLSDDSDDGQDDLSRRLAIAAIGSSVIVIVLPKITTAKFKSELSK